MSSQIILLEEVWEDRHADAIVKQLALQGYTSVRPAEHSLLGLSSGLLLLVKPPLRVVDWKFTPFAKNTFTDSFARKGVLEATLENPETGIRFVVVGTHMVALDTVNGLPKDQGQIAAHAAQTEQILSVVQRRSENGRVPALLLGDFNVGPGYADAAYRKIAEAERLVETGASLFPGAPLISWNPGNPLVKYGRYPKEPPAKIDHVFLQGGATEGWKALTAGLAFDDPIEGLSITPPNGTAPFPTPLSDHYGFLVEVELTSAP